MSASGGTTLIDFGGGAGRTHTEASSGVVANGVAAANLPAVAGKFNYLTGFSVTAGGATAGQLVTVTVTGLTNTLSYVFAVPTGATLAAQPLVIEFADPLPSAAVNTAITVSMPAAGAGNTAQCVNVHGYSA